MDRSAGPGRGRNIVIAVVLLAGLGLGLYLVLTGGSGDDDTSEATGTSPLTTLAPLAIEDTSLGGVNDAASLAIPEDADGFLTARLDNDTQLDVTFTLPDEAAVERFIRDSGLPELEQGRRLILHSSPLWRLNAGAEAQDPSRDPDDPDPTDDPPDPTDDPSDPGSEPSAPGPDEFRATSDESNGIRRVVEFVPDGDVIRARIVLTRA